MGGRDVTPGHIGYKNSWIHVINGTSEESQFQAAVLADRRV